MTDTTPNSTINTACTTCGHIETETIYNPEIPQGQTVTSHVPFCSYCPPTVLIPSKEVNQNAQPATT